MNIAVNSAALVVAPSISLSDTADAQVIAAGNEFERLFAQYVPLWLNWAKLSRRTHEETEAEFGDDYSSPEWAMPSRGMSPAHLFLEQACERLGTTRANSEMFAVDEEMYPLAEIIRAAEIQSLGGLRSKVLVAMWDACPLSSLHSGELEFEHQESYRSLLTGAAAVTGLSNLFSSYVEKMRASGTEVGAANEATPLVAIQDPIFTAIEHHRSAYQRHVASLGEDELEAVIPKERRRSDVRGAVSGDEGWRVSTDDLAWIAHIEESLAAHEAETDAAIALVSTENLSRRGALALLQYAKEMEAKDSGCWPDELCDDNGKRRTWHFFLMEQIAGALDTSGTIA